MDKQFFQLRNLAKFILAFAALFLIFFFSSYEKIRYNDVDLINENTDAPIGEISENREFRQNFHYDGQYLYKLEFITASYGRKNSGTITMTVTDDQGGIIAQGKVKAGKFRDNAIYSFAVDKPLHSASGNYTLTITDTGSTENNSATLYTSKEPPYEGKLTIDGTETDMALAMSIYGGYDVGKLHKFYMFSGIILCLLIAVWFYNYCRLNHGHSTVLGNIIKEFHRYRFLMNQLVAREFKTKYKRSVLGFFWSFLNPLLTMIIQYILFSTIFRSGIENFPVYLLSATVLFNFFTESVGNGLGSITGNASLIEKVSVPRYIYPVSRVLSSAVNMLISTIPLLLTIIFTGSRITKAYLCIPLIYILLIIFCVGMSLFLATSMVYFRDTQFLWSIVSLMWMYATPIFYPESIVPAKFSFIFKINPMYYFLKAFRMITISGISPGIGQYGMCALFALIFLIFGWIVFHRHEKNFALYL